MEPQGGGVRLSGGEELAAGSMVGHTTMLELTFVKQALQVLLTPSRQGGRRRIARSATTATAAMRKLVALSVTATAAVKGFDRRLMTDTDNTEMI